MIVLLISLALSLCTAFGIYFIFGIVGAVFPFLVILVLSYLFLAKNISKRLEKSMLKVRRELQKNNVGRALALLFDIKKRFSKWQFFTKSAIDGQIGSIYYMQKDYLRARPYLEKAFVRHWVAKAMLGVLYYRKKDFNKMNKAFETAVKYSAKQSLLWSIWAYCLARTGNNDQAISVLLRGKNKLGNDDPRINQNLINLQNKKRIKMRSYGEQWYQFHLELSPQLRQIRGGGVKFSRR